MSRRQVARVRGRSSVGRSQGDSGEGWQRLGIGCGVAGGMGERVEGSGREWPKENNTSAREKDCAAG